MTKKKALAAVLAIALVICVSVGATLAYFSDTTDTAENTFKLGQVNIKLSEAVVDEEGVSIDKEATGDIWDTTGETLRETRTDTGNVDNNEAETHGYDLVPGYTVDKDPTVTVLADTVDCYVRMKVTLDHKDEFLAAFAKHINEGDIEREGDGISASIQALTTFFVGYDADVWEAVASEVDNDANTITVTFNYIGELAEDGVIPRNIESNTDLEPIITQVTLPTWVDNEDAAAFANEDGIFEFQVDFFAEAIQAYGFDNAAAAWAEFDGVQTTQQ